MVVGISKRSQFRNERALQDLIRSVPGNDRCADCDAMNPGWASWNMGIFLCMRCAALHRKMGTHISKIKSLSMDSWTSDQVDNMKSHGNNLMNKIFNPRNVKPPVPTDIDEADACMERFIRQKYQHRSLEDGKPKPPSRQGSTQAISPEGSPPPLPPKPSRPVGFGLRSASSAADLRRISATQGGRRESPPPPVPSLGMGVSVNNTGNQSFESMMATLRDMGFQNERRNAIVLRELEGNLDKSIETLQRLGEGSNGASRARTPGAASIGASTGASSNPFDQLDSRPPPAQPAGQSYNPFDVPTSQLQTPQFQQGPAQSLEPSFQNLQVAQPLHPHNTGGYFHQQQQQQQQAPFAQSYFQQSATPASATFSQGAFVSSPQPTTDGGNNPFFQTGPQPQISLATPPVSQTPGLGQTNPFFTQPPSQPVAGSQTSPAFPPPRHANTMPAFSSTTAFGQPSPFQSQAPQLQAQPTQQSQSTQQSHNPFQTMTAPPTPHSAGYQAPSQFGFQTSTQQLAPQPTGRLNPANKNNILSLYNFSPTPAMTPENPQFPPSAGVNPAATGTGNPYGSYSSAPQMQAQAQAPTQQGPFQSAAPQFQTPFSQPAADPQAAGSSRNPFMSSTVPGGGAMSVPQLQQQPNTGFNVAGPPTAGGFTRSHMSQQSVDINGFQNGRHSPDAFASLSARYG